MRELVHAPRNAFSCVLAPIVLFSSIAAQQASEPATAAVELTVDGAVERGLQWLVAHQSEDGRWSAARFMDADPPDARTDGAGQERHDIGITGLALLALLGDGNTLRVGPHRNATKRATAWLRNNQDQTGLFGPRTTSDYIHGHVIASLAMVEAYGLSDYRLLKKYTQRSIDYLEAHRDPNGVWCYAPRDGKSDTSITTWALAAYRAAEGFNLEVNPAAYRRVAVWYDRVTDPRTGVAGYTRRGQSTRRYDGLAKRFPPEHSQALTAATLYGRYLLRQTPKVAPVMTLAADRIFRTPPVWNEPAGTVDLYYWYFGTLAMHGGGGPSWEKWAEQVEAALLEHQRTDGSFAGSWDPAGAWGAQGGRVYSTALAVLTLLVLKRG